MPRLSPEPAAPDADLHDQGDWDMDNMPRPVR